MTIEVFLERVPSEDISVLRCSVCKEQFHTSPVGPRKPVQAFGEHVRTVHPQAVVRHQDIKRLYQKPKSS